MLSVVKFVSVVVKTVDVLIVDEIVDMGSPVVAVLSSGATLLLYCKIVSDACYSVKLLLITSYVYTC